MPRGSVEPACRVHTAFDRLFAELSLMPNVRFPRVFMLLVLLAASRTYVAVADTPDVPLALTGGRLLTQTDQGEFVGDIVINKGKIVAVGTKLDIPQDARRIDLRGQTVTPGLIDARSVLWLTPAAIREAASDGRLNVLDGIDPLAEDWREVARQGVTAVYVQPSGNLGGSGAVLAVAPGKSIGDLVIRADAGGQATLGTTGTSTTSRDRFAQYDRLKKAFEAAKKYGEQKRQFAEYQAKQKRAVDDAKKKAAEAAKKKSTDDQHKQTDAAKKTGGSDESNKKSAASTATKSPPEPTPDPAKEFLLKLLARKVPLRIEAHREDDIAHAYALADEFHLRIVLEGVSYPRKQLGQLVQRRTTMVLGPVLQLEGSASYRRGRGDQWLTSLTDHDSRWALATFGQQPRTSRLLRVQAAAAIAQGVSPEHVLRSITRDAAAVLGIDDQLGTLAVGKRADIAVFAGNPLEPATPVRLTLSRGKVVYEASSPPSPPAPLHRRAANVDLPPTLPATFALKSTRILRKGTWRSGQVLVRNGKIAPVRAGQKLPSKISVYDLGDAPITPGFLVAHSDLGAASSIDDQSVPDASNIQAGDAYDPSDPDVTKLLEAGFLRVGFAPGSANVVAGAVCRVRLGAADPIRGKPCAIKFVLAGSARSTERFPGSLAGQVNFLRGILETRGTLDRDGLRDRVFAPPAIQQAQRDARQQPIVSVLRRQSTALFQANSPTEIRAAIQLIEGFKLRGVLVNPDEIAPFIDDLVRLDIGVIARPVRVSDYDRYLDGLAAASAAGVPIAFGTPSSEEPRITAAMLVNAGMTGEAALAGLTSGGAKLMGMPDNTCELISGANADLVVWNGSPLNLGCRPQAVIVDGKLAFAAAEQGESESQSPASTAPLELVTSE